MPEGLRSYEVNEMIARDVSLAKSLFCSSEPKPLDATVFRILFKPKPSPLGSNVRAKEQEILLHWVQFIADVGDGVFSVGMKL